MVPESSEFFWVGNHPGLDLANTLAVDARGERLELVADWSALVEWADLAGLIDPELRRRCRAAPARQQRIVLAWFRRLRSALRGVLEPPADASAAELAEAFDAAVAAVPVRLSYDPGRDRLPLDARGPLERLRLTLACAALDATRLDRSRVRRCESDRCVLLYYDTTRNRSRRWCDMAVCGNRAKARAHYHRTKR
jgi:predicted RNA-binding Zn ribbon-like protein